MVDEIKKWLGNGSINIFGMPFTGKDTQGQRLAELFSAQLLGGGDILRSQKIPDRVRQIMENGDLIPTADYLDIVLPNLSDPNYKNQPLILSAVGRWKGEEEGVIQATSASGHPLKAVVFLKTDVSVIRNRFNNARELGDRGDRKDDNWEAVERRLAEYRQKTLPVIEHYRQIGLLVEVDGNQAPDQVTDEILKRLSQLAKASYIESP